MKRESLKSIAIAALLRLFAVAAGEGFEPSQTESESVVLPLHNPAWCIRSIALIPRFCQAQDTESPKSLQSGRVYMYHVSRGPWLCSEYAFYSLSRSFLSYPSHGAPEDLKTVAEGICSVLKPKSLHDLGNFGSQVTEKCLHEKQSTLLFSAASIGVTLHWERFL